MLLLPGVLSVSFSWRRWADSVCDVFLTKLVSAGPDVLLTRGVFYDGFGMVSLVLWRVTLEKKFVKHG